MPNSDNDKANNEELSKALRETTRLAQTLLGEIQANAASLATLQAKLEGLGESVSTLSRIIRDGNGEGSIITRLALVEREFDDLKEDLVRHTEGDENFRVLIHDRVSKVKDMITSTDRDEKEFGREKAIGYLKLAIVAVPGAIALIIKLIEIL